MGFDFAGAYTKLVKHKLIECSFGERTAQVEFTDSPAGVNVRVTFESEPTGTYLRRFRKRLPNQGTSKLFSILR